MVAEEQCPTCAYDTYVNVCQKKRQRINQTGEGRFFKTTPCPLWQAKGARSVTIDVCPTCGRPLEKVELGQPEPKMTPAVPQPITPEVKEAQAQVNKILNMLTDNIKLSNPPQVVPMEPPAEVVKKERKRSAPIFKNGRPKKRGGATNG